jgi:hypothetical protein
MQLLRNIFAFLCVALMVLLFCALPARAQMQDTVGVRDRPSGTMRVRLDDDNCQKNGRAKPHTPGGDPTIDFEDLSGPPVFTSVDFVTCLNGDVTFTGGQILKAQTFLPADSTVVLGTSYYCDQCEATITIEFGNPVKQYSIDLFNGETRVSQLTITDDNGSDNITLAANYNNGGYAYSDNNGGVTFIQISSQSPAWNFSIDNLVITFQ